MKSIQVCLVIALCMGAVCAEFLQDEWSNFKSKYDKNYGDDSEKRFEIFRNNIKFILDHNAAEEKTFKVEINRFADLDKNDFEISEDSEVDFWSYLKGFFSSKFILNQKPKFNESAKVPAQVDWRVRIRGNEIKDQKVGSHCNSAYAFATLTTLEAHHFIENKKHLELSEQEIIDCSELNLGCNDGSDEFTYSYLIENGVALEKDYPYTAKKGDCGKEKPRSDAKVFGYGGVNGIENYKKALDQFGPLTVQVDASLQSFKFYKSGIFSDLSCNTSKATNEVVLYGYGHDNATGLDYWIIQNSWSQNWGDNGYMKIEMTETNSCINTKSGYYPLLDPAAAKDNETADFSKFGIGLVAFIAIAILLFCCCCCICICCIKWCVGVCCD